MTTETAAPPSRTATRGAPRSARSALPPAGPVWFSSVMGTGILATLLGREAPHTTAVLVPAAALTVLGVVLLVGLTAAFGLRVARDRKAFASTIRDAAVLPTWGTVSMGVLSIGSAALTVLPQLGAHGTGTAVGDPAAWVVAVDATCWVLGTGLGLVTAFGFVAVLLRRDVGNPVPAWGLPIVPPMVSATTGAALVPHLGSVAAQVSLIVAIVGCFVLSLAVGGVVFALAYHHHWRRSPLPIAASASAWIPLGVVGQSMAAAQVVAAQSVPLLAPDARAGAQALADAYGYLMLAVSVPVIAWAVRMTARGFLARMPFSPGWWALTFPIGTLALGTRLLGDATANPAISDVGLVAIGTLCGTWLLCATATVSAARRQVSP